MNKKKLLSILFHVLGWSGFILLPIIIFDIHSADSFPWRMLYNFGLMIGIFYLNYFFIVPNLLLKRRFLLFTLVVVALLAGTFIINIQPSESHVKNQEKNIRGRQGAQLNRDNQDKNGLHQSPPFLSRRNMSGQRRSANTVGTFIILLLSSTIRLTQEWYKNEKQTNLMTREKLSSELSFLKSQVNPHFLFNTLNGIYSLANKKSDKTPGAIVKLSELMRHMLYESEKEFISLEKEIEYLENYIELQKLRLTKEAKVEFELKGETSNKLIEPMLLIPFIENAFKHGVDAGGADIKIFLEVSDNQLYFVVENHISQSKEKDENSGIGLANIIKQLKYRYPGHHQLKIDESKGIFKIKLTLNLKK
jgi:hypothetical protein